MSDNTKFYKVLKAVKKNYNWSLDENNRIVATRGLNVYNPITAIANYLGVATGSNNKRVTLRVARALGFDGNFAEQVYNASNCLTNRGQSQIIRGKVRQVLGL